MGVEALAWLENTLSLDIDLAVPGKRADANLPGWLAALEIEPHPDAPFDVADELCGDSALETTVNQQGQNYLLWGVALLRGLLMAGQVPCFEYPRVLSLQMPAEAGQPMRATIALTKVDGVMPADYLNAVRASFGLLAKMASLAPTAQHKKTIFEQVLKGIVLPLRRLIPMGKSTWHVLRAAHARGIPFFHLGLGVFQLGWGSRARFIDRSTIDTDSAMGAKFAQDKAAGAWLIRQAGLPAPVHRLVTTEDAALHAANEIGYPLVIKPCDQDRGLGVSVGIRDEASVLRAFSAAQKLSQTKRVLIEREVPGVCHRLFVAHGQLLYCVKRHPLRIWGDGVRSVEQLILDAHAREAGRAPWLQDVAPEAYSVTDEVVVTALQGQGYSLHDIPLANAPVSLRPIESTAWGGFDEEVTDQVHPDNLAAALQAAALFKLSVAGVDIISLDISLPWHFNGAVINEVNYAPLLGGAAISRSYVPAYLAQLIEGDGTIPIAFYGTDSQAIAKQRRLTKDGSRCFAVLSNTTLDSGGQTLVLAECGLKQRVRALLLRPDVDALVVCDGLSSGVD
jgi:D-alanine-D-alanine ligase-like ATP-grasp enzyme